MPNLQSDGILADTHSDNGLLTGIPDYQAAAGNNSLRAMVETFDEDIANITALETNGWVYSAINTPTASTSLVTKETGYLLINAGTKGDSGENAHMSGTVAIDTATPVKSIGPLTSTATLMDAREIFFKTRLSLKQATIASNWTCKALFGWLVPDTAGYMTSATGAADIATGGGFGFHIGETGVLSTFSQTVDAYTAVDTGFSFGDGGAFDQTSADTFQHWIEFGARATWTDASEATGKIDFYVNKAKVATVTNGLPMTSTQTYGMGFEVQNGPAGTVDAVDMAIQSVTTAITRAGG